MHTRRRECPTLVLSEWRRRQKAPMQFLNLKRFKFISKKEDIFFLVTRLSQRWSYICFHWEIIGCRHTIFVEVLFWNADENDDGLIYAGNEKQLVHFKSSPINNIFEKATATSHNQLRLSHFSVCESSIQFLRSLRRNCSPWIQCEYSFQHFLIS